MRAARTLPYFLDSSTCSAMLEQGKVDAAIKHAFRRTQQDLEARSQLERVKLFLSGCTVACCLRHPQKSSVWLAHVGDSKSILMVPDMCILRETEDHTPKVAAERARVEQSGCEIDEEEHNDGTLEVRIFVKGMQFPGIMMTRSMGDLCVKEHGVIADPEVQEWPLDGRTDAMVLLASDGIWEFMPTDEVSKHVLGQLKEGKTPKRTIEELVAKSQELWKEHEEDYCDDITALLVPLGGPLPDPSKVGPPGGCLRGICKLCWPEAD